MPVLQGHPATAQCVEVWPFCPIPQLLQPLAEQVCVCGGPDRW